MYIRKYMYVYVGWLEHICLLYVSVHPHISNAITPLSPKDIQINPIKIAATILITEEAG